MADTLKRLEEDEYFLFYEMMVQSLKTDDVYDGINKSLYLLKVCLSSGHIVLHRKNEEGLYVQQIGDATMTLESQPIMHLVNNSSRVIERKELLNIQFESSTILKSMAFIHIKTNDHEYILSINNYDTSQVPEVSFWNKLRETMQIILKRAESYERNIKAINIDLLTGLYNRNSYEKAIQDISEADSLLVYGIFDLFRLKFINDNFSHDAGDIYIKEVAKILKKYWPEDKDKTEEEPNDYQKLYRIGGDEFVLLTTKEECEMTRIKSTLAAEEVALINLGIHDPLPLGLNYGIVKHDPLHSIKHTYRAADARMHEDKTQMYLKYKLERRH